MKGEYIADKVVEAIMVKLKTLDKVDRGILSDTSVTAVDRLAVILGSFRGDYHDTILSTKEESEDIKKILSLAEKHGVELGAEEIIILGKTRRFIAEKARAHGINMVVDKVIDIGSIGKQCRIKHTS